MTIGNYYEDSTGKVLYIIGGGQGKVTFYYEGEYAQTHPDTVMETWKHRPDLKDFPNAKDPRLPYDFDLLWDIKYMSQLTRVLKEGHQDYGAIEQMAYKHKLIKGDFPNCRVQEKTIYVVGDLYQVADGITDGLGFTKVSGEFNKIEDAIKLAKKRSHEGSKRCGVFKTYTAIIYDSDNDHGT